MVIDVPNYLSLSTDFREERIQKTTQRVDYRAKFYLTNFFKADHRVANADIWWIILAYCHRFICVHLFGNLGFSRRMYSFTCQNLHWNFYVPNKAHWTKVVRVCRNLSWASERIQSRMFKPSCCFPVYLCFRGVICNKNKRKIKSLSSHLSLVSLIVCLTLLMEVNIYKSLRERGFQREFLNQHKKGQEYKKDKISFQWLSFIRCRKHMWI